MSSNDTFLTSLFASVQRAVPQHGLTRLAGKLGASRTPWIKKTFIENFARVYDVNMSEAVNDDLAAYPSFNDFFTRALKPGVRPVDSDPLAVVSPADGCISQIGQIEGETLLQAKGHRYSVRSLGGELGHGFDGGSFLTVYLAPSDYHRVHLPFQGTLTKTLAIPGALFSVNGATENAIEGLFCRNERLVCRFETALGPMLVVLVGAMIVGSIDAVWDQVPTPYRGQVLQNHSEAHLTFGKADEIGRFLLGSTAICCFPKGRVALDPSLTPGTVVQMGQTVGLANS
ncbi:MAG: phosphatidylserine decarboxylase [Pseudomonadales bacterium]|nr:phosphatidylserine decarboxylase [Pseudomonadales bacterium]